MKINICKKRTWCVVRLKTFIEANFNMNPSIANDMMRAVLRVDGSALLESCSLSKSECYVTVSYRLPYQNTTTITLKAKVLVCIWAEKYHIPFPHSDEIRAHNFWEYFGVKQEGLGRRNPRLLELFHARH